MCFSDEAPKARGGDEKGLFLFVCMCGLLGVLFVCLCVCVSCLILNFLSKPSFCFYSNR